MTARKHRKWYVISTFAVIILFAALRKYTVGIDLELHYAINYERIAALSWGDVPSFIAYDSGFNILCKLLSYISPDRQFFIVVTSLIVFGSIGRYIYRHGSDVVLETFLFVVSFCFMMYMNIIAQAVALSVFLCGIDYLKQKKFLKYVLVVLLAASMHISAIVLLLLIPLSYLKVERKNVIRFMIVLIVVLVTYNKVFEIAANVMPEFTRYLEEGNVHGQATTLGTFVLSLIMIYAGCFVAYLVLVYSNRQLAERSYTIQLRKKGYVEQISTNLLAYCTMIAVCSRFASLQIAVSSRVGYYFCIFAFTLLARSLDSYFGDRDRKIVKLLIYAVLIVYFCVFAPVFGPINYGGVPYEFFWN